MQQPPENDAMDVDSNNMPVLSNNSNSPSMASSPPSVPPATTQFSSKRGLSMTWRSAGDVAQQHSLSESSVQLLSDLFSTSLSILNEERDYVNILQTMVQDIYRQSVTASSAGMNVLGLISINDPISLGSIAWRIKKTDKKGIMSEYENALWLIQFAIKLDVLREERGVNSTVDVIRTEMEHGGSLWSDEGMSFLNN